MKFFLLVLISIFTFACCQPAHIKDTQKPYPFIVTLTADSTGIEKADGGIACDSFKMIDNYHTDIWIDGKLTRLIGNVSIKTQ